MRRKAFHYLACSSLLFILFPLASAGENPHEGKPAGTPADTPAVRGLRVSSDRWPNAYTLKTFAEDAIRLERARTEEEEALALYDWITRVMTIGGSPHEGSKGKERFVADTLKIMNVYGNHWCDGQARLYETMWRSLGRQARRLYIPMRHHTFVELRWRDADGVGRWHALDVNNGWFVRNEQGWIASCADIDRNPLLVTAAHQTLKMRTKGWLHTHPTPAPEHAMGVALHRGESYKFLWDNEGVYFVGERTRKSVSPTSRLYKPGGPFSQFIGGGETIYAPKLAGAVSSYSHRFEFPYLIARARLQANVRAVGAAAGATISVSVDNGETWTPIWSITDATEEGIDLDLKAVRGYYSYQIRLESEKASVQLSDIKFTHRTMMNKMTLPNLRPGWNRLKVEVDALEPGSALRVTVEWRDKNGDRREERVARKLPYEFDVFVNGSGRAAVQMRSIRFEAVPDKAEEAAPSLIPAMKSGEIPDRVRALAEAGRRKDRATAATLLALMKDESEEIRYWAADSLGNMDDPRAVPVLTAALKDPFEAVRMSAATALGKLRAREAVPELLDLVEGKTEAGQGYSLFNPVDVGSARWMAARAVGQTGDTSAVPRLAKLLSHVGDDLGFFVAEALGQLGDQRAIPALLEVAEKSADPARRGAVQALGRIGNGVATPVLTKLLKTGKEDVRWEAAVALGRLGNSQAVAALEKASENDSFESVREVASAALERMRRQ